MKKIKSLKCLAKNETFSRDELLAVLDSIALKLGHCGNATVMRAQKDLGFKATDVSTLTDFDG